MDGLTPGIREDWTQQILFYVGIEKQSGQSLALVGLLM
jgi:hypothetical protein